MKRFALLLLLLPALAAACGSGYGSKSSSPSTTTAATTSSSTPTMNQHGTKSVVGASSVSVQMNNFYFSPTVIKGSPGQKLTLNLSNQGTVTHNFSLTSAGISQDVPVGKTVSVQVTFPKSGAVTFFCRFHKASGMAGELTTGAGSSGGSSGGMTTTGGSSGGTTTTGYYPGG
jgi:plastocyanin